MQLKNLFTELPHNPGQEVFETLLRTGALELERIVSTGQSTPVGNWYDQDRDEWVLLLTGSAGLLFEGDSEQIVLRPGDTVHIPAGRRHRVEWTAEGKQTIWLALHFRS